MSKQHGRGGMGNHKHGTSGVAPKSPRVRFQMKLEAQRNNDRKAKPSTCTSGSIAELFKK